MMPAVHFTIRWPDGSEERCYSPSTIVLTYFQTGQTYSVTAFLVQVEKAFRSASARVEEKFGYACASAADQLQTLQANAVKYAPDGRVKILGIEK